MTQPRAHGVPVLSATLRASAEDFVVEEVDAFDASGEGEHLLLTVRKRGMNTAHAARRIARWAGVAESAVGYAGLKDRHAVATQRFSVWLPRRQAPDSATLEAPDPEAPGESLQVLARHWHVRKLPRGALAGNRFVLTLRDVTGERTAIDERLHAVAARGVPNLFGEQRFGRGGANVERALEMFAGARVRREQRAILLSAARAHLFNRVLSARIADGSWDRGLDGEVWMLDGSRSVFGPVPEDAALRQRLAEFDIHPTAPLWGAGELRSAGASRGLEEASLQDAESLALRAGLERAGLRQERRATRVRPATLRHEWKETDVLQLSFALPAGSYATAVLAEIGVCAGTGDP